MKTATKASSIADASWKPERPGQDRDEHGRERKNEPEQQARRHEQLDRIVEVEAEPIVAPPRSAIRRSESLISALNAVSMVPT